VNPEKVWTLGEALRAFRRSNGLHTDEAVRRSWSCQLGPVRLVLPNFLWRRRAIEAHDLHHVLTGYACTMCGEVQMAAWEFGAGKMPHWAAVLFCLPLIMIGVICTPLRTFRAFAAGRRSRSLHGMADRERWLAAPLSAALVELTNRKTVGKAWSDRISFALLVLWSSAITMFPLMGVIYLVIRVVG
jgi:hypothetical protein